MAAKEKTLDDLFEDTLKDIYYAENKILKALPKIAKAAQSDELKAAFEKHLKETEDHVSRLEKVFKLIDAAPKGKKCDAIEGIIEEGAEIMKEFKGAPALDAAWSRRRRPSSTTRSPAMEPSSAGPSSSISMKPSGCSMPRWRRRRTLTKR